MKGFTLIELLVVVLIIGILSAVALPQYTKAVEKSRVAQVVNLLKAAKDAEEVYYMANGVYTSDKENLDIDWTCPDGWTCLLRGDSREPGNTYDKMSVHRTGNTNWGIIYSFQHCSDNTALANKLYCWAITSDAKAVNLCKSLGPHLSTSSGYARYSIQ